MKAKEIRELSTADIIANLQDAQAKLNKLHINHAVTALENASSIRNTRREIARLKTILTQRQQVAK